MVFAHDSFLGFVNLLRIGNFKKAYHPGDRPPYPIIIDSPSVRDVVLNMNRADLGFFCFLGLIGKLSLK